MVPHDQTREVSGSPSRTAALVAVRRGTLVRMPRGARPARSAGRARRPLVVPVRAELASGIAQIVADPSRPSGRLLLIDGIASGYVDLQDPARLGLDYLHRLA